MKKLWEELMTDANGAKELSCYSFLLTTVGIHVLLGYHEYIGIHATITEYAAAMGGNAAAHGVAYLTRK
jgi:hypothetical protein